MKKMIAYICLALIGTGIITVFWKQELVYSLPTPLPTNYKPVEIGQDLALSFIPETNTRPVFLHFFNPSCPCSRFNMKHFKTLIREYSKQVCFIVIVQTQDQALSIENIKSTFDLDVPCVMDHGKKIAESCGVYSTPQAVIMNASGRLYYRGNYNKARYCTDRKSDFAQMAIDSLLNNADRPVFGALATRPYGCSLPSACKENTNN